MDHFATTDMYLAGYLMALGYEVEIVDLTPTRREFHFPASAKADAAGYFQNAQVAARLFAGALRDLKSALHRPVAQGDAR